MYEAFEWVKCAIYRVEEEADLGEHVKELPYQTLDSMGNKELKVVR